jgi:hypothetical protein
MSNCLEPRQVSPKDIKIWFRETIGIFYRRPIFFLFWSLCFYSTAYFTARLPWVSLLFGLLLCQIFFSINIIFAKSVDESRVVTFSECIENLKTYIFYLMLLSVLYFVIYIVSALLTIYFHFSMPSVDYSKNETYLLLKGLEPGTIRFYVLYLGIVVSSFWFLNPLIILNHLGLAEAIKLAKKADSKNEWTIFLASYVPLICFVILSLISEISLAVGFALYPLFSIYQYVSYRHVFFGKKENMPVATRNVALNLTVAQKANY